MDKPNEFLLATAEQYPELADNLEAVSDYIDNLRHACGVAKNHLDQIIGAARLGITESEKIWTPSFGETVEWKREGETAPNPQNTADGGEGIDMPSPVKSSGVSLARDFDRPRAIELAAWAIAHHSNNADGYGLYWGAGMAAVDDMPDTLKDTAKTAMPEPVPPRTLEGDSDASHNGTVERPSFQDRVSPWMQACFGQQIAADAKERNHRFLEESLELVQACGCTASEAHQLVDYVYGRPEGERAQEVGGVMVTLAALCLAQSLDMHDAGETELARIWTKVEQIRAKQAAKPAHSPLPQ